MPGVLQQTQIYSKEVHSPSEVTCFILADALRYEMGVELMGLLENAEQLSIQPAIGSAKRLPMLAKGSVLPDPNAGADHCHCNPPGAHCVLLVCH